jgi:hypothetical protein
MYSNNIIEKQFNPNYKQSSKIKLIPANASIDMAYGQYQSKNLDSDLDSDSESSNSLDSWYKCRGKKVVLVEADNPWYINKKCTTPQAPPKEELNVSGVSAGDTETATFQSNVKLDETKPNMNMGYSYAARNRILTEALAAKQFEGFENMNSNNNYEKITLVVLVILILLLILYNYYQNSKKTNIQVFNKF